MSYFNIRVYGLLVNEHQELLLSDEQQLGRQFTKFPGGGLELGEGIKDCLMREFMEECNMEIEIIQHIYTTDFYEKSSFNDSQIISVYYLVKSIAEINLDIRQESYDFGGSFEPEQRFRWKLLESVSNSDLTFDTDRRAIELLKSQFVKAEN